MKLSYPGLCSQEVGTKTIGSLDLQILDSTVALRVMGKRQIFLIYLCLHLKF